MIIIMMSDIVVTERIADLNNDVMMKFKQKMTTG